MGEPTDEILTNHCQEFLHTPCGQTHVPGRFDRLQTVFQSQQEPEVEPFEEQANTREECIILFDFQLHLIECNSE